MESLSNIVLMLNDKMASIDENSEEVKKMVLSAENGNWDQVYRTLDQHPNFINCIPEDRTLAALHQAVWLGNETALNKLLSYPSCDSLVKTKPNKEWPEGGKTPADIAKKHEFKRILDDFTRQYRNQRFSSHVPHLVTARQGKKMKKDGLPLLLLTLYNYKSTFHPSSAGDPHNHFQRLLKKVFDNQQQQGHWFEVRDKIANAMKAFDVTAGRDIQKKGSSEYNFYETILKLYTTESVYRESNCALNREGEQNYKPSGEDLAIGPYILMLDVILFYWKNLKQVSTLTYRGVGIPRATAVSEYPVGNKFVWLQLVSSSTDINEARHFGRESCNGNNSHYVLFVIDNSACSNWRPREVMDYSQYRNEEEALYPAAAEFQVSEVEKEEKDGLWDTYMYTTIKLKLI